MATTLKQTEAAANYPTVYGLSTEAAALDKYVIWPRIEAYIAHRFAARDVVWIAEGPGEWVAPLTPATVSTVEVWEVYSWAEVTLNPTPLGGLELENSTYRISASVGGGSVPDVVEEAYKRLAEYMAETADRPGASSYAMKLGDLWEETERAPTWLARALQNSGAADLLRAYRRA
ncbi:MAG: hypothetical protein HWE39_23290 [Oceanospirillaceae bacterium]|uniref:hypothetical protein n=1 Tax=Salipiger sp. HF18 TaxID=2721557 RepID=UPI00142D294D|nr:hypothetical protein [Salipiger sp. HF18]NIY97281.1 hypothetical protein [Salipiger sp. HF18]NVK44177.1 hypothetical protein [Oceanospirillaceae bacterium]